MLSDGGRPSEGKTQLIEDDVVGDVYAARGGVEAAIALMGVVVAEKDEEAKAIFKLERIVGSETWPTCTPKYFEMSIVEYLFL